MKRTGPGRPPKVPDDKWKPVCKRLDEGESPSQIVKDLKDYHNIKITTGGVMARYRRERPEEDKKEEEESDVVVEDKKPVTALSWFTTPDEKQEKGEKPVEVGEPNEPAKQVKREKRKLPRFVYFMQSKIDHRHIKIGSSHDPVDRMRQLMTAHSIELVLLGYIPESRFTETTVHKMFESDRVPYEEDGVMKARREWFKPNQRLLQFIMEEVVWKRKIKNTQ